MVELNNSIFAGSLNFGHLRECFKRKKYIKGSHQTNVRTKAIVRASKLTENRKEKSYSPLFEVIIIGHLHFLGNLHFLCHRVWDGLNL